MRLGLASSTRDVDLIAPQYADPFMLADPNGARVVQKASLLAVFPNGLQLLRTQGHTSTTYGPLVKTLSMNTIGSRAQFVWCFEKPGAPAVEVDVDTTFMVYVNGLEEAMKGHSADRRWGFWLADHGLAIGGLALLAVGAATSWWAMSLVGWVALAIAFFAWVAETDGSSPCPVWGGWRSGGGGFDMPLVFKVRRGKRVLFFVCEEDPSEEAGRTSCTVLDGAEGRRRLRASTGTRPRSDHPLGGVVGGRE